VRASAVPRGCWAHLPRPRFGAGGNALGRWDEWLRSDRMFKLNDVNLALQRKLLAEHEAKRTAAAAAAAAGSAAGLPSAAGGGATLPSSATAQSAGGGRGSSHELSHSQAGDDGGGLAGLTESAAASKRSRVDTSAKTGLAISLPPRLSTQLLDDYNFITVDSKVIFGSRRGRLGLPLTPTPVGSWFRCLAPPRWRRYWPLLALPRACRKPHCMASAFFLTLC
jgi:hypothetical protein